MAALVLVLLAGVFSARRILTWGLRRVTASAVAAVPSDVPAARREEDPHGTIGLIAGPAVYPRRT